MHHEISSKYPPQRRTWQRVEHRNISSETRHKPCPFSLTPIRRLQYQPHPIGSYPFPGLFKPGHHLTGAAGKPEQFADPPDQCLGQHGREIGGNGNRTARSPGKRTHQLPMTVSRCASGF